MVCLCLLVTTASPSKTPELIEMLLGCGHGRGPRNHVLGGSLNSQGKRQFLEVVPSTEMHQTMSAENATTARDNRLVHRGQHVTTKARPQNGLTCYMGDRCLLHGWQVRGQCRLSSKFFHHLLTVVTLNKLFCKSGTRLLWTYNLI